LFCGISVQASNQSHRFGSVRGVTVRPDAAEMKFCRLTIASALIMSARKEGIDAHTAFILPRICSNALPPVCLNLGQKTSISL
jgi:hypothetical protein